MAFAPILTLVGAGISAGVQFSAARSQEKIARFNYMVEQSNARLQMLSQLGALQQQQAQSQIALKQAEINAAMQGAEAAARERNARLIRENADARAAASRESIRRKRLDFARFQASQRAKIAASGVLDSAGSPLELLAETAGQMQLAVEEMNTQANIDRATAYNEAEMESFGAKLMRSGANAGLGMAQAAAKIRTVGFGLDASRIRSQYRADQAESNIRRMVAFSDAAEQKAGALGTLFTGFGNYATMKDRFTYAGVS